MLTSAYCRLALALALFSIAACASDPETPAAGGGDYAAPITQAAGSAANPAAAGSWSAGKAGAGGWAAAAAGSKWEDGYPAGSGGAASAAAGSGGAWAAGSSAATAAGAGGSGAATVASAAAMSFCASYKTQCGWAETMRYTTLADCTTKFDKWSATRQSCIMMHLGFVEARAAMPDYEQYKTMHCPHAAGAAPCDKN